MFILHEIFADSSAYPEFFSQKLWRLLTPTFRCTEASHEDPCHWIGWGTRQRIPKTIGGEKLPPVRIQRFRCVTHNKTRSFLPSFLLPRLHYLASIVNDLVERYLHGEKVPALANDFHRPGERTLRRWVNHLRHHAAHLKQKVTQTLAKLLPMTNAKEIQQYQEAYRETTHPIKLLQAWALLKTLAQQIAEHRVPYHYALIHAP